MPRSTSELTSTFGMDVDDLRDLPHEVQVKFLVRNFGRVLRAHGANLWTSSSQAKYLFIITDIHLDARGVVKYRFWWKQRNARHGEWNYASLGTTISYYALEPDDNF